MKNKNKLHHVMRPIIALTVLSLLALSIWLSADRAPKDIYYGTVEGETTVISAQVTGQITAVSLEEGAVVTEGQTLASLDDADAKLRLEKVRLQWQAATAQSDKAQSPARSEDLTIQANTIKQLKAQEAQLAAQLTKAQKAKKQVENTLATAKETAALKDEAYQNALDLKANDTGSELQVDAAHLEAIAAQNTLKNAQLQLSVADSDIQSLKQQQVSATLAIASAVEKLQQLKSGVDSHDKTTAGLNAQALEKDVALAEAQLEKYRIKSPVAGVIEGIHYSSGELVSAGAAIATVVQPDQLTITLYIREATLPQIAVGDTVALTATVGGQTATGHVLAVAQKAMFTPMNVVTTKDRDRLVYPVKVAIDQPAPGIVPGMQLEARFHLKGADSAK